MFRNDFENEKCYFTENMFKGSNKECLESRVIPNRGFSYTGQG